MGFPNASFTWNASPTTEVTLSPNYFQWLLKILDGLLELELKKCGENVRIWL